MEAVVAPEVRQASASMKILVLTNYFPPEIGTGPHLPYELGESLVQAGYEVTVVTGFPRYNVPTIPERYRWKLVCREEMGGMQILRINTPNFYGNTRISRGLVQLLSPPVLAIRGLFGGRPDVVYTGTPPLFMGVAAYAVARRYRVPFVLNVQDLFPQTAIDLGVLQNRTLIAFFRRVERFLYRKATALTAMSDPNRDYVIARGADAGKVHTVFNWCDTESIRPAARMNDFRRMHGLNENLFVVLSAGTMGFFQGLDTVIDAARLLADVPDLLFLLVGGGAECERLQQRAAGLPNVRFLPMQPKELYPQVLAAADVGLVTLRPEVITPNVPSRISTIMAAARPILASLPQGEAARLVVEAQAGVVVPAGDGPAFATATLRLKENPAASQQMGVSGRQYAERYLSRTACVRRNEEILRRATEMRR
jgi:glycosyltransferase involved in cell wall biosynthesis